MKKKTILTFLRNRIRETRPSRRLRRPRTDGDRRSPDRKLPATLSSGTAHVREGGRGQQLRPGPLHRRKGNRRLGTLAKTSAGNTKGRSITVPLTSCLTCLESAV
jgi:hypothetical protein